MYKHIRMRQLLGAGALAAVTIACSNTAEGVKRDSAELKEEGKQAAAETKDAAAGAAESVGTAGRRAADGVAGAVDNAGRAGDAAFETLDVKAALIADSRIDSSDINVDTDHITKTVVLKGSVRTTDQKAIAGQIATGKAVGYRVDNRLTVSVR